MKNKDLEMGIIWDDMLHFLMSDDCFFKITLINSTSGIL